MGHQGQFTAVGGFAGFAQGDEALAAGGELVDTDLDAQQNVAVQVYDLAAEVDIAVAGVGQLPRLRGQTDRRDIEQGIDAGPRLFDYELPEAG